LLSSGLFRFLLVVAILCVWVVRCIRSFGEIGIRFGLFAAAEYFALKQWCLPKRDDCVWDEFVGRIERRPAY
jgi:hypothetical protein